MSWKIILKEEGKTFNISAKRNYKEFLSMEEPQDDSLTLSLAMYYVEQMLNQVSDDDKHDEAQEALELVEEIQKAIDTLEDVGKQLQEILPGLKILEVKAAGAITSTVSPGTATTEGLVSKPKYSVEEEEEIEPKMEHWKCD